MSIFLRLFGKKSSEFSAENEELQKIKWNIYDFFLKGQDCYIQGQDEEALQFFDKAFEHKFLDHFSTKAADIYEMRAGSLQKLDYHYDAIKDFDKSISLLPNDCNKYFSRSISKGAILDFDGQIVDLETAIELSKIDNSLNKEYNDEAHKQEYRNGVVGMFEPQVIRAKMNQDQERSLKDRIKSATSSEQQQFRQDEYDKNRTKRLGRIKKRTSSNN